MASNFDRFMQALVGGVGQGLQGYGQGYAWRKGLEADEAERRRRAEEAERQFEAQQSWRDTQSGWHDEDTAWREGAQGREQAAIQAAYDKGPPGGRSDLYHFDWSTGRWMQDPTYQPPEQPLSFREKIGLADEGFQFPRVGESGAVSYGPGPDGSFGAAPQIVEGGPGGESVYRYPPPPSIDSGGGPSMMDRKRAEEMAAEAVMRQFPGAETNPITNAPLYTNEMREYFNRQVASYMGGGGDERIRETNPDLLDLMARDILEDPAALAEYSQTLHPVTLADVQRRAAAMRDERRMKMGGGGGGGGGAGGTPSDIQLLLDLLR